MLYLISYDLRNPGRDYRTLWAELHRLGAVKVLESQYAVRRNQTNAEGLRNYLLEFIDANDGLLVVEIVEAGWAGSNLEHKISTI